MKRNATFWITASAVLLLLAIAVGILLTASGGYGKAPAPVSDTLAPIHIIGQYRVDDGPWRQLTPETTFDVDAYHTVVVRGRFSRDIPNGKELLVYVRNLFATLSINGHEVARFGDTGTYPAFMRSPGIGGARYRSPGVTPDDEVEVVMRNAYVRAYPGFRDLLNTMSVGYPSQLFEKMFTENRGILLSGISALILGVLALILAVTVKMCSISQAAREQTSRAAALSFFAFVDGFWLLLDSNYQYLPLLIPNPPLAGMCVIVLVHLMPAAALLLLLSYVSGRFRPFVAKLTALFCFLSVSMMALQLTGRVHLYENQMEVLIAALAALVCSIACLAHDALAQRRREAQLMLLALLPSLLGLALDSANVFARFMPRSLIFPVGCLMTLLLLCSLIVHMVKRTEENAIRTQRIEQELLKSRVAVMLSQIKPHFLSNALVVIRQLCDADPAQAKEAITAFSSYLRANLDSLTLQEPVPFTKELEHVQTYLALEQKRFGERLRIRFEIATRDFHIPALSVQPLVENAVRHGILPQEHGGTLTVRSEETTDAWRVTVTDDGPGYDPCQTQHDGRSHIGIANVASRLQAMVGGSLTVSGTTETGTSAVITIPKVFTPPPCDAAPSGNGMFP